MKLTNGFVFDKSGRRGTPACSPTTFMESELKTSLLRNQFNHDNFISPEPVHWPSPSSWLPKRVSSEQARDALPSSGGITSKTLFRRFSFEYIAAANPLCPSNSPKAEYVETPSPITLWHSVLSIVNLSLFLVLADLSTYNVRFLNLLADQLPLQQHQEQDNLMLAPGVESAQWPFHSTSFAHGFWTITSLWPSTSLTYNNEHACPCTITLWFSLCSSTCSPRVLGAPSMQWTSSLFNKLSVPSERTRRSRIRLEMDLEPGNVLSVLWVLLISWAIGGNGKWAWWQVDLKGRCRKKVRESCT